MADYKPCAKKVSGEARWWAARSLTGIFFIITPLGKFDTPKQARDAAKRWIAARKLGELLKL